MLANCIEIKVLKSKNEFEDVIFKSQKQWLVVVYADWDHNKQVWTDLYCQHE